MKGGGRRETQERWKNANGYDRSALQVIQAVACNAIQCIKSKHKQTS